MLFFFSVMMNPGGVFILRLSLSFLCEHLLLYEEGRKYEWESLRAYLEWEVGTQAQIFEFPKHFSKELTKDSDNTS